MSVLSGLFSFPFLTLALAWHAAGKDCETLDGKWYNQLGDEISLKHGDNGTLLGEFRTKYAGEPHSAVLGYAPYGSPDATFAFTVVWRNGSSTRVWTGQCFICADGAQSRDRRVQDGCGERKGNSRNISFQSSRNWTVRGHEQHFCFLCDLQEWCFCCGMGGTMPLLWRKQNRDHRNHVAPAHSDR